MKAQMKVIKQKKYGTLEIDNSEKDVVQIWMVEAGGSEVVFIERENIEKLIALLNESVNGEYFNTQIILKKNLIKL